MGGRGSKGGARGDGRRVYRREPGDWLWANRAFWTVALLALSVLLSAFRFVTLPQGGSVTFLSLLPLWLVTYFYGPRHGCVAGAVFGFTRLAVIFGVGEWVNFSPGAIVLVSFHRRMVAGYVVMRASELAELPGAAGGKPADRAVGRA